ncbi:MAG: DUF1428 domain-containing protein [Acetobacteraceae bacterium]|nr:MAG: DUF1428 domain-containing protein [Acetobacteraceae bacterium]
MAYIDGFLIPVPNARKDEYRAHEEKWWPWFRDKGATSMTVAWGDDVQAGKQTDFQRAVALQADESVVFAWMVWPDKATRDKAFAGMMEDGMDMGEMPFDGKRMVFGGFTPILEV